MIQLATHCWLEGGFEGYDRGPREAEGLEGVPEVLGALKAYDSSDVIRTALQVTPPEP